ncbi:OLC1v1032503C1 [Oldenlandia corymbosa var. corymbosa]|uniref:OLC1v1032503C1 n=1 Tax=Oldenlandia corymbosa var. corymbosa TaxID=529605 RepID=A0AAV1CPD3_OLDCO|nr:OLC1v1032503C1 [Oldenlandia corymbosa var. corymbosa]
MDSSNNIGDTEECSSNESGWTMYIASPIQEDNPDDDDDDDSNHESGTERREYKDFYYDDGGDGESDDSMASDASSGPSHQGGPCVTNKGSHGRDFLEHAGGSDDRRSTGHKSYKQIEKKERAQKPKPEKEQQGRKVNISTGDVYSKGKSRKNNREDRRSGAAGLIANQESQRTRDTILDVAADRKPGQDMLDSQSAPSKH